MEKPKSKTYYEILKVSHNSTKEEIKKKYKEIVTKIHPDKVKPENKEKATKVLAIVNEAYETLINEEKRKKYDQKIKQEIKSASTSNFFNFGTFSASTSNKKAEIVAITEVSLEDLYNRKIKEIKNHKLKLRPELRNDETLTLVNKEGEKIEVVIKVKEHPLLKIEGKNLIQKIPISLKTAILGGIIEIYTLDGIKKVKINQGVSQGEMLKLEKNGWFDKNGNRGNMLVEIQIEIPQKLKSNQLSLFEKFCESLGDEPGTIEKKYLEKIKTL